MQLTQKNMDHLSEEALHDLIKITGSPCISIYMPTHRRSVETEQDPIRLKNLLSEVERRLLDAGERRPDVVRLLEPMQQLVEEHSFWQQQNDGLALFRTDGTFLTYRLPASFEEVAVAGERPYIKPLLPLLSENRRFYLLALSQDLVRFFQADRFQIGEIELEDTPTSLEEAMRFDEYESQLQFHTGTGAQEGSDRAAAFHGHSDAGNEAVIKENIKRFLRRVDAGVRDHVEDQRTPLVLAGVEMMRGLFREVGQYANIADEGVDGNPEMLSAGELHEQAWPLVEARSSKDKQEALDAYKHLAGNDDKRAASELAEIVPAAYFQAVDSLFVAKGAQRWGEFDPEQNRTEIHDQRQPEDLELCDFAAAHTLLNGGSVYVVEPDEAPGDGPMSAVLRYAVECPQ